MVGMCYFSNMVGYKEDSANQIGLPDSAMGLRKETTMVTSFEMGVGIEFSTYYTVEHYTTEAKKKKLVLETYQIVAAAINGVG